MRTGAINSFLLLTLFLQNSLCTSDFLDTYEHQWTTTKGLSVTLRILDVDSTAVDSSAFRLLCSRNTLYFILFDLTSPSSLSSVVQIASQIGMCVPSASTLIVGTRSDLCDISSISKFEATFQALAKGNPLLRKRCYVNGRVLESLSEVRGFLDSFCHQSPVSSFSSRISFD